MRYIPALNMAGEMDLVGVPVLARVSHGPRGDASARSPPRSGRRAPARAARDAASSAAPPERPGPGSDESSTHRVGPAHPQERRGGLQRVGLAHDLQVATWWRSLRAAGAKSGWA